MQTVISRSIGRSDETTQQQLIGLLNTHGPQCHVRCVPLTPINLIAVYVAEIPGDGLDGQQSGGPPSSASVGGATPSMSGIPSEALAAALMAPGPGKAWPAEFVAAQRREVAAANTARSASVSAGEWY